MQFIPWDKSSGVCLRACESWLSHRPAGWCEFRHIILYESVTCLNNNLFCWTRLWLQLLSPLLSSYHATPIKTVVSTWQISSLELKSSAWGCRKLQPRIRFTLFCYLFVIFVIRTKSPALYSYCISFLFFLAYFFFLHSKLSYRLWGEPSTPAVLVRGHHVRVLFITLIILKRPRYSRRLTRPNGQPYWGTTDCLAACSAGYVRHSPGRPRLWLQPRPIGRPRVAMVQRWRLSRGAICILPWKRQIAQTHKCARV